MTRKRFFLLFALLIAGLVMVTQATAVPAGDLRYSSDYHIQVVRAYFHDREMVHGLSTWTEPWEVNEVEGYVVLGIRASDYTKLFDAGFSVELDAEMTAWANRPNVPLPGQGGGIPGYPCYRTVEETLLFGVIMADLYPDLAEWIDAGDSWQKTADMGGYDMMVLRLTNEAIPGPKPVLFITSAIHAREYTTAELATRFAEYLLQNYGDDPDITWILDYHEVHLMLQTNPDGRKRAEQGLLWRKNTNNNYCANSDSRGADLNRNFEFQWGCCGGSSSNQCSETYRGAAPASEPEVQAAQNYGLAVFPDQRDDPINDPAPVDATGVYVDIHSYSQLVLWPWGFTPTDAPNGNALRTLGRKLAYFNSYTPQQAFDLYVTDGTTDDFFYGELGVASYTFELGTAFFQSCTTFENTILPNNLPALLYAAKSARTPYMTVSGPDALNLAVSDSPVPPGSSVTLTAQLNDTRFNNSNGSEPTQPIAAGEYYVDTPPWAEGTPYPMTPADGNFNSTVENVTAVLQTVGLSEGQHTIFVRGQDSAGNWGVVSAIFLTIEGEAIQGTVEGYLTDELTGSPLAGTVSVPALALSTTSNPLTGFYLLNLPAGNWDMEANATNYTVVTASNVVVNGNESTPLDLALARQTGSLMGQLLDSATAEPVIGTVNVPALALSTATDSNGNYTLTLPFGSWDVLGNATDYDPTTIAGVIISPNQTTYLDILLEEMAGPVGFVTGQMTDNLTGDPIVGTVSLHDSELFATTDPVTGVYSFTVPAGVWRFDTASPNYIGQSIVDVEVQAGQITTLDFALDRAEGTITGQLTNHHTGTGVAGTVTLLELTLSTATDANGFYTLTVPFGNWTLEATAEGYESAMVSGVEVPPFATTGQDFALMPITYRLFMPALWK